MTYSHGSSNASRETITGPRVPTLGRRTPVDLPEARTGPAGGLRTYPRGARLPLAVVGEAGVAIADAEGLAALSMRGVAARLGVAAMSPHRYVTSKDDLVLLMADAVYGELSHPSDADAPEGWRARLELSSHTLWSLYRRHPWLAHISPLTRPLMLPNLMVHAEWALGALDGLGLTPETMMNLHVLGYGFLHGMAADLEREAQAEAATGLSESDRMDHQTPALEALAASGDYPAFTRVAEALAGGYDLDLDVLFELGLTALLDGFAVVIEGRSVASP
ncbi:TetR/AcrR family transcriptional regulator [Streptomyces sp. NPDC055287]